MSAFHRIDDIGTMPAQRLIDFALRLFAYKGVVRMLAEAEHYEETHPDLGGRSPSRATSAQAGPTDLSRNRVVEATRETMLTDPAFAGMVEVKGS